jgi:hypothetical protein
MKTSVHRVLLRLTWRQWLGVLCFGKLWVEIELNQAEWGDGVQEDGCGREA